MARLTDSENIRDILCAETQYTELKSEFYKRVVNSYFRDVMSYVKDSRNRRLVDELYVELKDLCSAYVGVNGMEHKFRLLFYDDVFGNATMESVFAYHVIANVCIIPKKKGHYNETSLKSAMKSDVRIFDATLTRLVNWYKRCEQEYFSCECADIDGNFDLFGGDRF